MSVKKNKTSFWSDFKNFHTLDKKTKRAFLNLNILIFSCLIIFPILIAHIVFVFNHKGPFWYEWFLFIMTSIVVFGCGSHFFIKSFKEIFKWHKPGMSTLVMLSSLIGYFYSIYPLILNTVMYAHHPMDRVLWSHITFFASSGTIVTIIKFGDTVSDSMKMRINDDLEAISSLQVQQALLYNPQTKDTTEIDTKEIKVGDWLMVKKGGRFPVDGVIISGETEADESMLTGESKPIPKFVNDKVIGSTNNMVNTVIMKATVVGKNTVLNSIINNVKKISKQKPRYQQISDKVAQVLIPLVISLAILAFILWAAIPDRMQALGDWFTKASDKNGVKSVNRWSSAVFYAVSTLCVACPCALGLAVPLATLVGSSKAAKNGIIINKAEAYEKIKKIDAIAFDKTGTLTQGVFSVSKIIGDLKNLPMMLTLEKVSMHPLATGFNDYVEATYPNTEILNIQNIVEIPGVGLEYKGIVEQNEIGLKDNNLSLQPSENLYQMTSLKYVLNENYKMSGEIKEYIENFKKQEAINVMQSITCFSINKEIVNLVVFEDQIKPEAFDVINLLKARNIEVYMISGDNEIAVKFVADQLGIEHYFHDVKPSEKSSIIKSIQDKGKIVAYVGDGINDLEALKQSDLSIAINKENSIANAVSDVLILNKELMSILKTVTLTKLTRRMIIFNITWAFVYNIIALPLTVIGFIPAFIGVFIMGASDISILSNTLIFKTHKFRFVARNEINRLGLKKSYNFKV